ncbi:hypothetical protein Kpol_2002p69 [Vanderwaltozyma polyspora DSM 70294]|uniref:Protein LST4 n=1 Tax=Vanderwaltozyma polyspora (strain ATCC 22028 / DSM 70294 / BCRC 21397 / CBS 2163 / NBRC 10782 / NRRL Y-8283 / UCD 57-17) TaxID=436907 RepID=LST4_VANPO|nr:uncharacterized protein Kpol_2002p69 [Vanderwaltozyma polyspora DSM 70294]A7TFI4.1 RecName: Full=Protein LST4 [Vanderwaltozyma polyspora DSM 70294]EDO18998.1 hypothetical protein Kpol_2002p69 [Vanderwaltozyma polyspora DSM 70294]
MLANLFGKNGLNGSTASLSDSDSGSSSQYNSKPSSQYGSPTSINFKDDTSSILRPISGNILDHMSDDLKSKLFATKDLISDISLAYYDPKSTNSNINISPDSFRLLLTEETGQMVCRNNYRVVLDYVTPKGSYIEQIRPSELKEYIFGSPVRSSDSLEVDKIRVIPNSNILIISRTFHVSSKINRLAICLCLPSYYLPVVMEAWRQVSTWLDNTQASIISIISRLKKPPSTLHLQCDKELSCLLPADARFQFVSEFESIILALQRKIVPCLRSISEIPRLFLYPTTLMKFVELWFKDVFNWMELKDGPRMNFLSTLLAIIIVNFKEELKSSESTRIAIMSGNMVVSNKLINIISGILEPKYKGPLLHTDEDNELSTKLEQLDSIDTVNTSSTEIHMIKKTNSNSSISVSPASTKYQNSNKGWEIPRRRSAHSVASISSGESLAEVIQPSSLKSGSNSLHQLYASLSNNYGTSYGSWFNKRPNISQFMQYSSPSNSNESWDRAASIHRTNSGNSIQQLRAGFGITPQQSPSISEYDEYPWFGTPNSPHVENSATATTSNTTVSSASVPWTTKSITEPNRMYNVHIERDFQRISQTELLDDAFDKICKPGRKLECGLTVTPGNMIHAGVLEIEILNQDCVEKSSELLPRYTSYLRNYNSWFKLQAFPANNESESKVITSMKKDLSVYSYSKALLISLSTRDIKEVTIKKEYKNNTQDTNSFKLIQKTARMFHNGKPQANLSLELNNCILLIESTLKRASELLKPIQSSADTSTAMTQEARQEELLKLFKSIIYFKDTKT